MFDMCVQHTLKVETYFNGRTTIDPSLVCT